MGAAAPPQSPIGGCGPARSGERRRRKCGDCPDDGSRWRSGRGGSAASARRSPLTSLKRPQRLSALAQGVDAMAFVARKYSFADTFVRQSRSSANPRRTFSGDPFRQPLGVSSGPRQRRRRAGDGSAALAIFGLAWSAGWLGALVLFSPRIRQKPSASTKKDPGRLIFSASRAASESACSGLRRPTLDWRNFQFVAPLCHCRMPFPRLRLRGRIGQQLPTPFSQSLLSVS